MRIALFTESYLPLTNGVVTHIKTLKEGFEKLGHEVLVVTTAKQSHHTLKDGVLYCPAASFKRLCNCNVAFPVSRVRMKYIKDFNPDVIHIHTEFGIGISGILAAKRLKKPIVYTLHTMYDDYLYYVVPKPLQKPTAKLSHQYFKFIANRAQVLTGPSEKSRAYLKNAGVKKEVNVIPNAVALDEFSSPIDLDQNKKDICKKYNIDENEMLVCFVGRLGKEKSIDVLLEYWKKEFKPEEKIHLMIIGDGPFRKEFEELTKRLGIDNMVTFTGAIDHSQVPPYYAACDAYVTASLTEVYSISMLEAMASGLPVIQRLDPLNAGQIIDGVNGYKFNSSDEMAKYIRMIKNMSPQELKECKEKVAASVHEQGTDDLAKYMIELYGKIIQ